MAKKIDFLENLSYEVRHQRQSLGLTQAKAAALCGVGTRFMVELEQGKQGLHLGKVVTVLNGLGLDLLIRSRRGK